MSWGSVLPQNEKTLTPLWTFVSRHHRNYNMKLCLFLYLFLIYVWRSTGTSIGFSHLWIVIDNGICLCLSFNSLRMYKNDFVQSLCTWKLARNVVVITSNRDMIKEINVLRTKHLNVCLFLVLTVRTVGLVRQTCTQMNS